MINKIKYDKIILFIFLLYFILKTTLRDILGIISQDNIYMAITADIVLFALIIIFSNNYLKEDYKTKYKQSDKLKPILFMYVFSFISKIMIMILFKVVIHSKAIIPTNQDAINSMVDKFPIIAIITACILAPVVEEYIFREILYKYFLKVGVVFSVVLTGFLFGIMHLFVSINNTPIIIICIQSISYITTGLYLGYVRYKYGSVTLTIFLHIFGNTMTSITHLLGK